jgi:hypothetical protein
MFECDFTAIIVFLTKFKKGVIMNPDTVLYVCGFIFAADRIYDIYVKYKRMADSPTSDLRQRVQNIEDEIDKIHGFLARDKARLDAIDRGMSVLQRAILALIDNAIEPTNKEPLLKAKDALDNYLIDKGLEA